MKTGCCNKFLQQPVSYLLRKNYLRAGAVPAGLEGLFTDVGRYGAVPAELEGLFTDVGRYGPVPAGLDGLTTEVFSVLETTTFLGLFGRFTVVVVVF